MNTQQVVDTAAVLPLGGFPLLKTTTAQLTHLLQQALEQGDQHALFFANTNFIVKCQEMQDLITRHKTLIVNDGIGIDIATWLVHREKFPENLNGTDFVPHYLHTVRDTARVYLLGGKPGIAIRAAHTLKTEFGVDVVGMRDGYEQARDENLVVEDMNSTGANVVLVAMGNPGQEMWISRHRPALNAKVLFGVGALLDFLAGDKPRAPKLVQKLHMEWFYRLCLEPARLMRRYTIDIAVFLSLCLRSGKQLSSTSAAEN